MSQPRIVELARQDLVEFAEERISGALLGGSTPHASITMGVVPVGQSQRHHLQRRPNAGTEVILVYAGQFVVEGAEGAAEFDASEQPVLVEAPSGVPCSLSNVGAVPVQFFTVFSPPFEMGEIEWLE